LRRRDAARAKLTADVRAAGRWRVDAFCVGQCGPLPDDVACEEKPCPPPGELPHSRLRFEYVEFGLFVGLAGGLSTLVFKSVYAQTFLDARSWVSTQVLLSTGVSKPDAFLVAFTAAWSVELWHYPCAMAFGLLGTVLTLLAEIVGAVLQTFGLKLLCKIDETRLNAVYSRGMQRARACLLRGLGIQRPVRDECLSLGALLQPLVGGVLVGLIAVLQPFCLGEGTAFFKYLLEGTNGRTLNPGTLIGVGLVKILATRVALGFGFVGGKYFPTMFLGSCVGCAIFMWANPADVSIIQAADMPLLFPFSCLFCSTIVGVGAMFISIPLTLILTLGLNVDQTCCVVISCATAYMAAHGLGRGLVQFALEKKLLVQLDLLDANERRMSEVSSVGAAGSREGEPRSASSMSTAATPPPSGQPPMEPPVVSVEVTSTSRRRQQRA